MTARVPRLLLGSAAAGFAAWARLLRRANNVTGGGLVRHAHTEEGTVLSVDDDGRRWARLTGTSSPYGGTEVYPTPGGGWADLADAPALAGIYEDNGEPGLAGKVVRVRPAGGEWRFRYDRGGATECATRVRFTLLSVCGETGGVVDPALDGSVISLESPPGTVVASQVYDHAAADPWVDLPGPGTYHLGITLPSPWNFTRTADVTYYCGDNSQDEGFVLALHAGASATYCVPVDSPADSPSPDAHTMLSVTDAADPLDVVGLTGLGTWAGGTFTPTEDIHPSALAGETVTYTYKGKSVTAGYAGGCNFESACFVKGVGAIATGCNGGRLKDALVTTDHGGTGTTDEWGRAFVELDNGALCGDAITIDATRARFHDLSITSSGDPYGGAGNCGLALPMEAAPGYHCCLSCVLPLPGTLHMTITSSGGSTAVEPVTVPAQSDSFELTWSDDYGLWMLCTDLEFPLVSPAGAVCGVGATTQTIKAGVFFNCVSGWNVTVPTCGTGGPDSGSNAYNISGTCDDAILTGTGMVSLGFVSGDPGAAACDPFAWTISQTWEAWRYGGNSRYCGDITVVVTE